MRRRIAIPQGCIFDAVGRGRVSINVRFTANSDGKFDARLNLNDHQTQATVGPVNEEIGWTNAG
jgi:hypothetical protein